MQLGSAARSQGTGENAVRAEINVTPLVDVCLVLLIIFMVVTPLLQQGVDVALPATRDPVQMPEGVRQTTIALKADGSVYVGQNWIPRERLATTLADLWARSPEKNVVVKADRRLPYREVREVLRRISEAGFAGAGLVTVKQESEGG